MLMQPALNSQKGRKLSVEEICDAEQVVNEHFDVKVLLRGHGFQMKQVCVGGKNRTQLQWYLQPALFEASSA